MKLASLRGGRDGRLAVVSRDLSRAVLAQEVVPTLQAALDDWAHVAPELEALSDDLARSSREDEFPFVPEQVLAPLPRAYQWLDGSAYVNHVELVRKARGASMPERFWTEPLMYQGGSDIFLGPREDICVADEAWGIDLEGEIAVVTDDVPTGVSPDEAENHILLLMLANDVSLRNLIPEELKKGFGFLQSKPPTAFSPVAVTPDELGPAWDGRKLHRPVQTFVNDALLGAPHAGVDMVFDFPTLLAHAARTRPLSAGTILGSGTVSNQDRSLGSACLAEKRMLEQMESGQAKTPFLRFGDRIRLDVHDARGRSIFGAIEQTIRRTQGTSALTG